MSEEFSSIGHLGPERRPGNRFYLNADKFIPDIGTLGQEWENLASQAAADPEAVSRLVLRGIVSDSALEEIRNGEYAGMLEAVIPLGEELGRPDNNLIYLGRNEAGREPLAPIEEIIEATSSPRQMKKSPADRIHDALQNGNTIKTAISPEDYEDLYRLWGTTFGWTRDQIEAKAHDIENDHAAFAKSARNVWFSGVQNNGRLVAAAMAERLTLQGSDGPIDLIESTEWSVKKEAGKNGYGATALAALNAQILSDFDGSPFGRPVIFAECNFKTRADWIGTSVGMAIPSREYANQVLPQNVEVVDGKEPAGFRDFNLMYLPLGVEQEYYRPDQNEEMLGMIESGQAQ